MHLRHVAMYSAKMLVFGVAAKNTVRTRYFNNEHLSDLLIVIDSTLIPVHRVVLAARQPDAKLQVDTHEAQLETCFRR